MAVRPDPMLLLDPRVRACPYELFDALQLDRPIARIGRFNAFVVTRYEDVDAIVRDTQRFSSQFSAGIGLRGRVGAFLGVSPELLSILREAMPMPDTLLSADPPAHTRYRSLLNRAFTPKRVAATESRIAEIAHQLIDRFIESGHTELVSSFAVDLPLTVIAEQLGVDVSRRADFKRWSDDAVASLGGLLSHERQLEVARSLVEFQKYMSTLIEERRREPTNDLLSVLLQAELEGQKLEVPEILSMVDQLIVAGNETTTTLLANAVSMLAEQPNLLTLVRNDDALLERAIEEVLRLRAPVQAMMRIAREDVTLQGVEIPKGSVLFVAYAAANVDEGQFSCPMHLDLERDDPRAHLAFGRGPHHCIGASLARAEAKVGLRILFTRLSDLRLDPQRQVRRRDHLLLPAITELHLQFRPGRRREGQNVVHGASAQAE